MITRGPQKDETPLSCLQSPLTEARVTSAHHLARLGHKPPCRFLWLLRENILPIALGLHLMPSNELNSAFSPIWSNPIK